MLYKMDIFTINGTSIDSRIIVDGISYLKMVYRMSTVGEDVLEPFFEF